MIAVLDYGIGNIASAHKALLAVGADAQLVTTPETLEERNVEAIVLPGVGAFGACMQALRNSRLDRVVNAAVEANTPLLGICVGMQMLFDGSEESPGVAGLGVFRGLVRRLSGRKIIPQMQWNSLDITTQGREVFDSTKTHWMYFVHSYAADAEAECVAATCDYDGDVVAAVLRRNTWAVQFHPEKSGDDGLSFLRHFVAHAYSLHKTKENS